MKAYCLGFVFNPLATSVLLLRKARPANQRNRWNGIGGKLEPGETPLQAMDREAEEEAGLGGLQWSHVAALRSVELSGDGFEIAVFSAYTDRAIDAAWPTSQPESDEPVKIFPLDALPLGTMPNVHWLIQMCLALLRGERAEYYDICEIKRR